MKQSIRRPVQWVVATRPTIAMVGAMILLGACTSQPDGDGELSIDSATVAPSEVSTDSIAAGAPTFDSDPRPLLPGEGEPREYRILLVNRHARAAHVFASASAARVALDTVAATDSLFVDVRLRADHVLLEAEEDSGAAIDSTSIDLVAGQINRWEIVSPDRGRVTEHGSRPVLVAIRHEEYPRNR